MLGGGPKKRARKDTSGKGKGKGRADPEDADDEDVFGDGPRGVAA